MDIQKKESVYVKLNSLKEYLKELESVSVAFSGGVDSAFLLKIAHDVLGSKVIAVTAKSCAFPEREIKEAEEFCRKEGIRHIIFETKEFEIEGFDRNPENRCYLCKRDLLERVKQISIENQMEYVAEGSNIDDEGDYRPGAMAVVELDVKSPLKEAQMTKADIRLLSKEIGLKTWDKQSFACLYSRFAYGETITVEKVRMVDKAEQFLYELGFSQFRVRMHGMIARIEILPEEFNKLLENENREKIVDRFKDYGFSYISLDLKGYRTGSMNETL